MQATGGRGGPRLLAVKRRGGPPVRFAACGRGRGRPGSGAAAVATGMEHGRRWFSAVVIGRGAHAERGKARKGTVLGTTTLPAAACSRRCRRHRLHDQRRCLCLASSHWSGRSARRRLQDDSESGIVLFGVSPNFVLIGQDRDCFVKQANHWSRTASNSC